MSSIIAKMAVLSLIIPSTVFAESGERAPRKIERETVLERSSLRVTPINAGINPDAFALTIQGTIKLGNNPCEAAGISSELEVTRKPERARIVVTPKLKLPR